MREKKLPPRTVRQTAKPCPAETGVLIAATTRLSIKQQRFLEFLIVSKNVKDACRKSRVSHVTAYRWLAQPSFNQAYLSIRRSMLDYAISKLQSATTLAVQTLMDIASNGDKQRDRVLAASAILRLSVMASRHHASNGVLTC